MSKASDKLLRVLLNKAHAVGQDDYREGVSDQGVRRRYDELNHAESALVARIIEIESALENAYAQFDFTVAALSKGQTVSISSLQNCAANARAVLAKLT